MKISLEPVNIKAFDLPDAWFQALWKIVMHGKNYKIDRGSFEGHYRKEFDFVTIHITNPESRPIIPDIPPGLSMAPPTSMNYVEDYFVNYLMSPELQQDEQYTYGNRIATSVNKVIDMLKKGHGTNQAIMEIARPEDIELSDPPCLRLIDCRISSNKLHFVVYFRSWDLWGGFSANLAGIQLLKEYMAGEIGVEPGDTIAMSKGLHLYDYAWEFAKQRVYK